MRREKLKNGELKLANSNAQRLVPLLLDWFAANARDLPWRRTRDPYAIWVSEIMLQQTQVKTVIPYFERWMRELPSIDALANASSEKIHKLWEGLGYYTRVRNMQRAAQVVATQCRGNFPAHHEQVLALPGIGRYTAGAICSIAFDQPTPVLDGNVIRVLTRVYGIRENARDKTTSARLWQLAHQLVTAAPGNKQARSFLNQSLMEIGAIVCTPRAPRCDACPIRRACVARREDCAEELPNLGTRAPATARRFVALVVQRRGATLLRQRSEGVVNAHLWEFPNFEVPLNAKLAELNTAMKKELGCSIHSAAPLGTIRHTITRYRIALEVLRVELNGEMPRPECGMWKSSHELAALPLTSAHRRVAKKWVPAPSAS